MPKKKDVIEDKDTPVSHGSSNLDEVNIHTIKALYQYNPNTTWLASYLGVNEEEIKAVYGDYLSMLDVDRTKVVEFTLYYLATVRQDIRAVLAWLEVYDASHYGKASTDTDAHTLKLDILAHLAKSLPG